MAKWRKEGGVLKKMWDGVDSFPKKNYNFEESNI